MAKTQTNIVFKGHVQGIGFRFTVERIAIKLGVVGWIKNLADGNVEVLAEADRDIVDGFLDKIRDSFKKYIVDEEINVSEATGKFNDFQVRF